MNLLFKINNSNDDIVAGLDEKQMQCHLDKYWNGFYRYMFNSNRVRVFTFNIFNDKFHASGIMFTEIGSKKMLYNFSRDLTTIQSKPTLIFRLYDSIVDVLEDALNDVSEWAETPGSYGHDLFIPTNIEKADYENCESFFETIRTFFTHRMLLNYNTTLHVKEMEYFHGKTDGGITIVHYSESNLRKREAVQPRCNEEKTKEISKRKRFTLTDDKGNVLIEEVLFDGDQNDTDPSRIIISRDLVQRFIHAFNEHEIKFIQKI